MWKRRKTESIPAHFNETKIGEFLSSASAKSRKKEKTNRKMLNKKVKIRNNERRKSGISFLGATKLIAVFNLLVSLACLIELIKADNPTSPFSMGDTGAIQKLTGSIFLAVGYASFPLLLGIMILNISFLLGKLKSPKYVISVFFATVFFSGISAVLHPEFGGITGYKIKQILTKLGVPENFSIALLSSLLFGLTFATLHHLIPTTKIFHIKKLKTKQKGGRMKSDEEEWENNKETEARRYREYDEEEDSLGENLSEKEHISGEFGTTTSFAGYEDMYDDDTEKTEIHKTMLDTKAENKERKKRRGKTELHLDDTTQTTKHSFISMSDVELADDKGEKHERGYVQEQEEKEEESSEVEQGAETSSAEWEEDDNERKHEEDKKRKKEFILPPVELLDDPEEVEYDPPEVLHRVARELLEVLNSFGVRGKIISMMSGPVVNFFEFVPETGTRATRILQLSDDIAIAMRMEGIRIIAPVPGSGAVGFEVPRKRRSIVRLKEIIDTPEAEKMKIPLTIGKDIYGNPFVIDLQKLPHLLVAGTTGSGKSVLLNTIIIGLLMRFKPTELKFILVDPKMLEFSLYSGIPNLVTDVITSPRGAIDVLRWAVDEMLKRYQIMKKSKTKNIDDYIRKTGEEMPKIIVVIDEFADLMVSSARKVEEYVMRLSQMARAAGIHLILTTQRPSADVVTGIIKSNLPARIALRVSDKINSRVIIDTNGAETLLGQGDFLFSMPGIQPKRGHASYISDEEIMRVVEHLKTQGEPDYIEIVTEEDEEELFSSELFEDRDPMYREAVKIAQAEGKISISSLQRKLSIGFNRAGRIVDQMVEDGIIKKDEKLNRFVFVGLPTTKKKHEQEEEV